MLRGECTTSPNPFSLQGEGEPYFFLVPLSFARRGARGEVFTSFHVTSIFIYLRLGRRADRLIGGSS